MFLTGLLRIRRRQPSIPSGPRPTPRPILHPVGENPPEPRAYSPHCDQRVLHAPGECKYCDMYPDWQDAREVWMINFTGHNAPDKIKCPSEMQRSVEKIELWPGNVRA